MRNERIVHLIAAVVIVVATTISGTLLHRIVRMSDEHVLRYTDVSVEGAPGYVAIGRAIGALRGLIVTFLWIKVDYMKSEGLFYEVMKDAEMITRLQPRFPGVWSFQGHNMAYNISVIQNSEAERWEWVQKGIRLVRNEGIRHNPNDIVLHKDLAFWIQHKIGNVADDAHLYYKTELAREWHFILGAWIKRIADAPESYDVVAQRNPDVQRLTDALHEVEDIAEVEEFVFALDRSLVRAYVVHEAIEGQSRTAQLLSYAEQIEQNPETAAFYELARDSQYAKAWEDLLAYLRKRILIDEYNMSPQLMYEYTRDLGPLDWRHSSAHALYWARRGLQYGERRVVDEDRIYEVLNTARIFMQSMQELSRNGRIYFDPAALNRYVSRGPDPRWIDPVSEYFDILYQKYYDVRGGGADTFIDFLENFLGNEVRGAYRRGELAYARRMLDRLDARFGMGAPPPYTNSKYAVPLDVFVRTQVNDAYQQQPTLAPAEVQDALYYGYRVGLGQDRPDVLDQAIRFSNQVTEFFRTNDWNNYTTRFGSARIGDLIDNLEMSTQIALTRVLIDPMIPIEERATIWSKVDEYFNGPRMRQAVYDQVIGPLDAQFRQSPYSVAYESVNALFAEPPDMEQARVRLAEEARRRAAAIEARRQRDQTERRGSTTLTAPGD